MLELAKIKQLFESRRLDNPSEEFLSLLKSEQFNSAISGREKIAIAVGSRGITNLPSFLKQLVDYLVSIGIESIITPAMGSHGYATADGQEMALDKLGINKQTTGAEIISSMDVISLGQAQMSGRKFDTFVDKTAFEQTDGVILINRIKPHTDFVGKYESGLVKMATVGLGNHEGAQQVHSLGVPGLKELMPKLAEVIFNNDKLLGGFAIIEDPFHDTASLHWLNSDRILDEEPALLQQATSLMPHLPIEDIDLLIIKQMGKDISGVGIDPKIIGRIMIRGEVDLSSPKIELIAVCDLTDATYGNALGIGLADFTTKRLFNKIDFAALKENILTATFYQRGKIPLILEDEKEILQVALDHFKRRGKEKPKVLLIKDTLNLSDLYVSESVLEALKDKDNIEIISEPAEIQFDDENKIVTDF
jgi:hypothetical protein